MSNQLKEFIDAAEALVDNNPLELTALIAKTLKEKFPLLLDDVGETNGDQVLGLGVVNGCTDYDLPQYSNPIDEYYLQPHFLDSQTLLLDDCVFLD
jgi:hypothetical protein